MMYLIWGLLNIGLLIYFLTICLKATKLIRDKIGLFAAIIFVIGFLSMCNHTSTNKNNKTNTTNNDTWTFNSIDSLNNQTTTFQREELEKNLISKYFLEITYGKDKNEKYIPISAYISTNGFKLGTNLNAISITINKTEDNKGFKYIVVGTEDWNLLGTTIYTRIKTFKGIILAKSN